MAQFVFKLPDVGEGIAEAEVVKWHASAGDMIEEDQPLVDVMTDKATVEISAPVSGRLAATFGQAGSMLAIGSELAVFDLDDDGAGGASSPSEPPASAPVPVTTNLPPALPAAGPPVPSPAQQAVVAPPSPGRSEAAKPVAPPSVRARARDLGVALQYVQGSGPAGRIGHADLDAYVAGAPGRQAAATLRDEIQSIKVVGLRRRIADKMAISKRHIPHFSYIEEVDVTELEALRQHLNGSALKGAVKLTLLPFFVRAVVAALPDFPQMNALFDDEAGVVHRHSAVHVGIAVQTDGGLMAPVLRHAETRGLRDMAAELVRLAQAARNGAAKAEELSGSTITITSLGPLGGVAHTPVINHPEVAIVGPNRVMERPVVREGAVVVRKMMNLSSSFDHRVVDGYDAAAFIQRLKGLLEHPGAIFVD